ncbi:hypothetical protein SLS62_004072 [Diatrype stigma]|uniref:Uncharacterized protein n=1 Tax=Diatrype stigma TaxID=117547 RepID=A0AAN9UTZ9_9PEZI
MDHETSAGGNYNLSFLSPGARRSLSPLASHGTVEAFNQSLQGPFPPYALVPYEPFSLYLPRAGFLWTDRREWVEDMGIFKTTEEEPIVATGEDDVESPLPQRSFFADPLARRHPWVLELAYLEPGLNGTLQDYRVSRVMPDAAVYLRSRTTGRYLGTVEGKPSIVDRELGGVISEDASFLRLEVGLYVEPSFNTTWLIEYDQFSDTGLRLYNLAQRCQLGTSYRTYVDYDGEAGNDTVSREIRKVVETTCTRGARAEASTFWVIEGQPALGPKELGVMERGYEILHALADLYFWRRTYGKTLELQGPFEGANDIPPARKKMAQNDEWQYQ